MKTDKEKLALKELAGYLPYGLKVVIMGEVIEADGYNPMIFELVGLDTNYVEYHEIGRTVTEQCVFSDCFPILRPLSELTKEITHNGETFVPNNILNFKPTLKHVADYPFCYKDLQFISHHSFNKLMEWHFDVFGLIERNLAVNLNDLPNE